MVRGSTLPPPSTGNTDTLRNDRALRLDDATHLLSGDQMNCPLRFGILSSTVRPSLRTVLPFGSASQSSSPPRTKATHFPSGDHSGQVSAGPSVS